MSDNIIIKDINLAVRILAFYFESRATILFSLLKKFLSNFSSFFQFLEWLNTFPYVSLVIYGINTFT